LGAFVGALLLIAPSTAAAARGAARNHKISHSESTNWSGYAVAGYGPYSTVS
jgi:hypothetical protein